MTLHSDTLRIRFHGSPFAGIEVSFECMNRENTGYFPHQLNITDIIGR